MSQRNIISINNEDEQYINQYVKQFDIESEIDKLNILKIKLGQKKKMVQLIAPVKQKCQVCKQCSGNSLFIDKGIFKCWWAMYDNKD